MLLPKDAGPLARQVDEILTPFHDAIVWASPRRLLMSFALAERLAIILVDVDEERRRLLVENDLALVVPTRRRRAVFEAASRMMGNVTNSQIVVRPDGGVVCYAALELGDMQLTPLGLKAVLDTVYQHLDGIRQVLVRVIAGTIPPERAVGSLRRAIVSMARKAQRRPVAPPDHLRRHEPFVQ